MSMRGNSLGMDVGIEWEIWELDRVSLRSMASGGDRPFLGPGHRDIRGQTRTLAPPEAAASLPQSRCHSPEPAVCRTPRRPPLRAESAGHKRGLQLYVAVA